jgi:hypothetical protein
MMPNRSFYTPTASGHFVPRHIIYLNVRPSADDALNGVLFVVSQPELDGFDRREWIYNRTTVTSMLGGVTVEGGEAYVYVGKPEWRLDPDQPREWAALRQSYLDIIEKGLTDLGPEFRRRYVATTDTTPLAVVFPDVKLEGTHPHLADTEAPSVKKP